MVQSRKTISKIINKNGGKSSLNYPVKLDCVQNDLLGDIAAKILNNNDLFEENYSISSNYFVLPYNFKENTILKEDNKYFTITFNKDFDKNSIIKYKSDINTIFETSLSKDLEDLKEFYKNKLKDTFLSKRLDVIKAFELVKYSDSIFNLFEIIDNITEDDIKNYIKTYFINQEPIIEIAIGEGLKNENLQNK